MHRCSKCGIEDKLYERGLCDRCALKRRASVLMAGPDGTIPAALVGVYDAVVASATPRKALNWLRQGAGAPILAAMASGAMEVSHEALDAHPRRRAADHVRQMLVANGALAARDEQLVRLERRISEAIAAVGRPADRKVLTAFATWRVLRNVRREAERSATGRTAISHARNQIVGAASFLDWLAEEDLELATCTQGDLERWLVGPPWRYDVRHFLTWTTERKVSSKLTVPPLRSGPGDSLDAEERWAIIQQLLRDPTIATADRVAGCFVLCYAQRLSHIATMTVDRVNCHSDVVSVRFGRRDVVVPQPLAGHVRTLVAAGRSSHVGIGSPPKSSWLFPGHLPGRPITASRLGQRLAACGIKDARAARRSALQQLAAEMPAVVIAELLGISVRCAVGWVQAAGGDWARYAGTTARDRITER